MPLCDTVLRLAAAELFEPYWSETILEEVCRNLVNNGRSSTLKATARIAMCVCISPKRSYMATSH